MAKRAGARITEIDGSHVIMISQAGAVAPVILDAVEAGQQGAGRRRSIGAPPADTRAAMSPAASGGRNVEPVTEEDFGCAA
jgi:hypothetical protein